MAKEKIVAEIKYEDDTKNVVMISPKELLANSDYTFTISGVRNKNGELLEKKNFTIRTEYKPMYCTLTSLKMITDAYEIPDDNMRSYIRDASKYADYIISQTKSKIKTDSFAVENFVKTKATYDCLMRMIMSTGFDKDNRYKLDVIEYEHEKDLDALRGLLDDLAKQIKVWEDAVRGYWPEGRAKPKVTRIGIKSSSNTDVAWTTTESLLQDIARSVPQWS
jgi:hypothetical protein|nr:MAG TPA: hypothetical protein [Bacteriophage sp.]DAY07568.1 MAG TPA: hypothetical protein [Caudoviricetes sp.]